MTQTDKLTYTIIRVLLPYGTINTNLLFRVACPAIVSAYNFNLSSMPVSIYICLCGNTLYKIENIIKCE